MLETNPDTPVMVKSLPLLSVLIPQKVLLLSFLVLFVWRVQAQDKPAALVVENPDEVISIIPQVTVLEDVGGKYTLEEVLKKTDAFQPLAGKAFTSLPTTSVFWFRFRLQNHTGQTLWLTLGRQYFNWNGTLYIPDSSGRYTTVLENGYDIEQTQKAIHTIPLQLFKPSENTAKTFYLRLYSGGDYNTKLKVGTTKAIYTEALPDKYIQQVFIGVMIGLFLFNLILLGATQNRTYVYYLLYLIASMFPISLLSGIPMFDWLWQWHYTVSLMGITFLFTGIFTLSYLRLQERSRFWFWLVVGTMSIVSGVLPLLELFSLIPQHILRGVVDDIFTLLFYLSLLGAGVFVWLKHDTTAKFYVLAWGLTLVGLSIYILAVLHHLLPENILTSNALFLGGALQAVLFGLALGQRIVLLQREKQELIVNQNYLLEKRVREKTASLQETNEQLAVSNEELTQSQEEIATQRDRLEQALEKLTEYQNRIGQSIEAAKMIQAAILPTEAALNERFAEHFIIFSPKDVISGDFYWMHALNDTQTVFIEGDCTGHGIPGAFMTLIGNTLLDQFIRTESMTSPVRIMEQLHDKLNLLLQQSTSGDQHGMDLSILVMERTENQEVKVTFGGAHQSMYYIHPGIGLTRVKGSRKRIGGVFKAAKSRYEEESFIVPQGTTLYLGSDGYADQNNAAREKIGTKHMKNLLQEIAPQPLAKQKEVLLDTLKAHMGKEPQRDDILVIGLRL